MLGDEVKDVYNALRKLRNREIEIENEEMWVITSWILQAKHNKKANMYEVLVSKIIPKCSTNKKGYSRSSTKRTRNGIQ